MIMLIQRRFHKIMEWTNHTRNMRELREAFDISEKELITFKDLDDELKMIVDNLQQRIPLGIQIDYEIKTAPGHILLFFPTRIKSVIGRLGLWLVKTFK